MKLFKTILISIFLVSAIYAEEQYSSNKKLAYIVSDMSIPFWQIMSKGIENKAAQLGYEVKTYSSNNLRKNEIKNFNSTLKNVSGIVLSPVNSSSAVFLLKLAKKAKIPVVISDIGTERGEYVSFISSDNEEGAYKIGKVLAKKMKKLNMQDGSVGIIAIPQRRTNGKKRTKGFLKAIKEEGIKSSGFEQQTNFSLNETYQLSKKLIKENPNMKALWLQGSDKYQGALNAISEMGKSNKILLVCFDSEPEFIELISEEKIIAAAMQQPFLMGETAVNQLDKFLNGKKVEKNIELEVLAIHKDNINAKLKIIKKNVLGIQE